MASCASLASCGPSLQPVPGRRLCGAALPQRELLCPGMSCSHTAGTSRPGWSSGWQAQPCRLLRGRGLMASGQLSGKSLRLFFMSLGSLFHHPCMSLPHQPFGYGQSSTAGAGSGLAVSASSLCGVNCQRAITLQSLQVLGRLSHTTFPTSALLLFLHHHPCVPAQSIHTNPHKSSPYTTSSGAETNGRETWQTLKKLMDRIKTFHVVYEDDICFQVRNRVDLLAVLGLPFKELGNVQVTTFTVGLCSCRARA